MKRLFIALFILTFTLPGNAQKLQFNSEGKFKIVQFTDVHFVPGNKKSLDALRTINNVLDAEKPDMVVFTGDIVTGKPAREGLDSVFCQVNNRHIPFAYCLGNHDDEQDLKREVLAQIACTYQYNVNIEKQDGVKGFLNTVLPVYNRKGDKPAAAIYTMDSNTYSTVEGLEGYGWFTENQIDWYKQQSNRMTQKNDRVPLPSLAFFHIPLQEYTIALLQKNAKPVGEKNESEAPGSLNSGMFFAMLQQKDIMGMFVGHDHDNDYMVDFCGIKLAYGRFTGGKTTYTKLQNGARVIVMNEGERDFTSYIRLSSGEVIKHCE